MIKGQLHIDMKDIFFFVVPTILVNFFIKNSGMYIMEKYTQLHS
jgi:hypothetical protein